MPGLGFSVSGQRLGRGKGYYDTYLQRCTETQGRRPLTVAVAFSQQICDSVPMDQHDVPVDLVVYPEQG